MSFLYRAFLYVTRKFSKSLLLFLILLVIATLTLSGVAIQGAAKTTQLNVRQALGGVYTLEQNQNDPSKWVQKQVISEELAKLNNLKIGDMLTLRMSEYKANMIGYGGVDTNVEVEIVGLFKSTVKSTTSLSNWSMNNSVYTTMDVLRAARPDMGDEGFERIQFYANDPGELDNIVKQVNELCVLTVIASASAAGEVKNTLVTLIPAVLGLIICFSGFCAWLCGRSIVRPVRNICSVSKRMAQLDMTWRCDEGRSDELGVLADSLNSLSERLTLAMKELETANNRLKLDVESSKTMEKQRRDFFAAASHELKTPVTVLKGQLESMELGIGDYKNHEKYLPEAIAAVESIESLIGEILTISRMETGISPDAYTDEMLSEMVNGCVAGIQAIAAEKHMQINIAYLEDVRLRVYQPLFKKALTNILSNAVRYSPAGATIHIKWTKASLTVFNGGVQIPDDDVPLLFTPFYRAEKSRNRKNGGSGLGLYIVKTILDLHGFGCTIENIDAGVRCTITFA